MSIASENEVTAPAGISITVSLQDVLLSVHESGLAFKLTATNGYIKNCAKIFEVTDV